MSTNWDDFTPVENESVDWSAFEPVAPAPKKGLLDRVRDGAASLVSGAKSTIEDAGDGVVDAARAVVGLEPRYKRGLLDDPNAMGPQKPKAANPADALREQMAGVPVEKRLVALEQMAKADDAQGQAAKALLTEVRRENQVANVERLVDAPRVRPPEKKLSTGKNDKPAKTVIPEAGEIGFGPLDRNLQPATPDSIAQAEAEATEVRRSGRSLERLKDSAAVNASMVGGVDRASLEAMGKKSGDLLLGWAPDQVRDTTLSLTKFAPTLLQISSELASLAQVPGSRETRDFALRINAMIDGARSESEKQKAREFQAIMSDPDTNGVVVAGFLAANPDFLLRQGIETAPSVVPGALLGRASGAVASRAGAAALRGQTLTTAAKAEIDAMTRSAATRGAVAGETLQGASATYNQLLDQGATPSEAALGALVTGLGYAGIARVAGAGLEGKLAGGKAEGRIATGTKEMFGEYFQAGADEAGMAVGESRDYDAQKAAKEGVAGGAVGFGLGAAAGGGKTDAQILADAINGNVESSSWAVPADAVARENLRGQAADPSLIASTPLMPAPRPTPRVEEQPTTPLTAEQIAAMAPVAPVQPAQPVEQAQTGAAESQPIGVAAVGQGSLAQRAASVVEQPQQTATAPVEQPADSGLKLTNFKSRDEAIVYATENRIQGAKPVQVEGGKWALSSANMRIDTEDRAKADEIDTYSPQERESDLAAIEAFNQGVDYRNSTKPGNGEGRATLVEDPTPVARVVRGVARQLFGLQVVVVDGVTGGDGMAFQLPGGQPVAFVRNGAKPTEMTVAVAGHEATHSLFRERPDLAARYQGELESLLRQGVVENRRRYEGKPDTEAGRAYAAEEVAADVSGSMWLREDFWRKLAELDTDLFRGLRYRFMANMAKMLDALGANKAFSKSRSKGGKERFDLDALVTDIAAARDLTARIWAEKAIGKKLTAKERKVDAELDRVVGARASLAPDAPMTRGVLAEVAPNPNDEEAVKRWDMQNEGEQASTTRMVATRLARTLSKELGFTITAVPASGYFEGKLNSSFVLSAPDATMEQLQELARLTGFALEQKAVIAFDERLRRPEGDTTFAKVIVPRQMTTAQVDSLRQHMIERTGLDGDTLRDGAIFYGNFSGKSDAEFEAGIKEALSSFEAEGEVEVQLARFASDYIGDIAPGRYEQYLEGTRYEIDDQATRRNQGRPVLRRRGGGDSGQYQGSNSWVAELRQLRDGLVSEARAARQMAGEPGSSAAQDGAGSAGGGVRVSGSYGEYGREGAIAVDAFHFSQQKRTTLISAMHGSGLKGAERERLAGAPSELRQRINFYFDIGRGVQPEAGVGGHLHGVRLQNVYDVQADKLGLVKQGGGINAIEKRILDAGFDGYLTREVYPTPNVVLLGKHSVPVDYLGTSGKFKAANPLGPSVRMSRDDKWDDAAFARMDMGDVEKISDDAYNLDDLYADEKLDLQDELDAAMGQAPRERPDVTPMDAKPADIKAAGLLMEEAFPMLDWKSDGSAMRARASIAGRLHSFVMEPVGIDDDAWLARPPNPREEFGEALTLYNVSEQAARSYSQRIAASFALFEDGYDLLSVLDRKQRQRVEKLWAELAQTPSAFEFETDIPDQQFKPGRFVGASFVARAQDIADSMLQGSKYQFDVAPSSEPLYRGQLELKLRGSDDSARIELDENGPTKRIHLHAIGLSKGSGAGKAFYQVASRIAKDYGVPIVADPDGLTAVNTYRRTEQMLSSALRNRDVTVVQPGYGQRIYGWKPGKAKSIQAENLIRLALANARNAKEAVPIVDQLRYDLATGKFTMGGEDAEARVTEALKRPDVRAMSVSRSTLARAALTFEAMQGEVSVPDEIQSPVLYSRDEAYTPLEALADEDYKAAEGRELVIRSGDASLRIDAAVLLRDNQKRREAAQQLLDCLS